MNDEYVLSTVNSDEIEITEHEIGHGFGLNDFYEEHERPPGGFPTNTIMWAGNSDHITDWDIWMLRYTWSQLKKILPVSQSRLKTTMAQLKQILIKS